MAEALHLALWTVILGVTCD